MTQPPPPARFTRTLTFFMIVLTSVLATMAMSSWQGGEPSPLSLFAERSQVVVTASTVQEGRTNGAIRYRPLVVIEWPQGSGQDRALTGVEPTFFDMKRDTAEAIAARYTAGSLTTVRVIDGQPVADRIDLFRMGHALFLSVFTVLAGLFTYVFFRAHRAARKAH